MAPEPPFTHIDHVVCLCPKMEAAVDRGERLLGFGPQWLSFDQAHGIWTAEFRARGGAIEWLATTPGKGAGFRSLVLGTDNLERAREHLAAAGFEPGETSSGCAVDQRSGQERTWRRFRCPDEHLFGVKLFVIQRDGTAERAEDSARLVKVSIATDDAARARSAYAKILGETGASPSLAGVQLSIEPRDPAHTIGANDAIQAVTIETSSGPVVLDQ